MKVNDIFYENDYWQVYEFLKLNPDLMFKEITPDEHGRRFQIIEIPFRERTEHALATLKTQLASMDYKTSKYVDGDYTEEQWQEIVAERQAIRAHIRELEKLLNEDR